MENKKERELKRKREMKRDLFDFPEGPRALSKKGQANRTWSSSLFCHSRSWLFRVDLASVASPLAICFSSVCGHAERERKRKRKRKRRKK